MSFSTANTDPEPRWTRHLAPLLLAWLLAAAWGSVVLTHWNGVPIHRAVELNAAREAGSNAAARHAQGLEALTNRWLQEQGVPDMRKSWIVLHYGPKARG